MLSWLKGLSRSQLRTNYSKFLNFVYSGDNFSFEFPVICLNFKTNLWLICNITKVKYSIMIKHFSFLQLHKWGFERRNISRMFLVNLRFDGHQIVILHSSHVQHIIFNLNYDYILLSLNLIDELLVQIFKWNWNELCLKPGSWSNVLREKYMSDWLV